MLVLVVILTAGMFAGFAFGATAHDIRRQTAPLLLQSSTVVTRDTQECEGSGAARQIRAAWISTFGDLAERRGVRSKS